MMQHAPRPGLNPKTGEEARIQARRVVAVPAGYTLKIAAEDTKHEAG